MWGDTVWLEGRGGTVPGEVMGEETKAIPSRPINPDLECDRCIGYLDRCMSLLRVQKVLRSRLCGTSNASDFDPYYTDYEDHCRCLNKRGLCYDLCVCFTKSLEQCEGLRGEL